jgi:hypothetical protein
MSALSLVLRANNLTDADKFSALQKISHLNLGKFLREEFDSVNSLEFLYQVVVETDEIADYMRECKMLLPGRKMVISKAAAIELVWLHMIRSLAAIPTVYKDLTLLPIEERMSIVNSLDLRWPSLGLFSSIVLFRNESDGEEREISEVLALVPDFFVKTSDDNTDDNDNGGSRWNTYTIEDTEKGYLSVRKSRNHLVAMAKLQYILIASPPEAEIETNILPLVCGVYKNERDESLVMIEDEGNEKGVYETFFEEGQAFFDLSTSSSVAVADMLNSYILCNKYLERHNLRIKKVFITTTGAPDDKPILKVLSVTEKEVTNPQIIRLFEQLSPNGVKDEEVTRLLQEIQGVVTMASVTIEDDEEPETEA